MYNPYAYIRFLWMSSYGTKMFKLIEFSFYCSINTNRHKD